MFRGALFALRESNRERGQVTNLKNALYDSPDEEALHQHAIQNLADETNRPVDEVRSIYETAYLRLKPDARITDYLPVLVARRTAIRSCIPNSNLLTAQRPS